MLNGKAMIVYLTVGLIKRHSINEWIFCRTEIFKIKSQIWIRFILLCNKADLKNPTGTDTSKFAENVDLAD